MATYKGIQGYTVEKLSSDPPAAHVPVPATPTLKVPDVELYQSCPTAELSEGSDVKV